MLRKCVYESHLSVYHSMDQDVLETFQRQTFLWGGVVFLFWEGGLFVLFCFFAVPQKDISLDSVVLPTYPDKRFVQKTCQMSKKKYVLSDTVPLFGNT